MAVAKQIEFRGGTLDQYDQVMDKMGLRPGGGADRPQGLLFHWVMKTDDGIRVTDLWESKDQFDQFDQTSVVPMTQQVGLPGPPDVRFFDVHNYL